MSARATLSLGKRARYEGRLSADGARAGRGTLYVDEGAGRESALRVSWSDDVPHGPGSLLEPDGSRVAGVWCNGELAGLVREEHPNGSLRFLGYYSDGERNGDGLEVLADGGCLAGAWVGGVLHGQRCGYLYPCAAEGLALVGEWRSGALHRAYSAAMCNHDGTESRIATSQASCAARLPELATHPAIGSIIDTLLLGHGAYGNNGHSGGERLGRAPPPECDVGRLLASLVGRRDPRSTEQVRRVAAHHSEHAERNEWPSLPFVATTPEPYEARRVRVRPSRLRRVGGDHGAGEGLFAARALAAGEVAAFFGGVRVSVVSPAQDGSACESSGDEEGADGAGTDDGANDEWPPAHVDLDWAVPTDDGWVWVGPQLRQSSEAQAAAGQARAPPAGPYRASSGHKANHAGWRANCELVPFEHPLLGSVRAVRVLRSMVDGIDEGEELTVDYAHLVGAPAHRRPCWLTRLLDERTEEGYYAHLRFTPPRTLFSAPAGRREHGRLKVVEHGPWRVLWFGGVEQGMTCHAHDGALLPSVVGFDYQRTMVAAAAALTLPRSASSSAASSTSARVLLVGLGAGSCAAAVESLLGGHGVSVEVVDNDSRVIDAAEEAHRLSLTRVGPGSSRPQSRRTIRVVLDDASAHMATMPRASLNCVLLDAYDAKGCVPAHLQAEPFVRALATALAPGGVVVANLWNATAARRAEADAFVAMLARAVGAQPFALRVVGHEKNRILVAVKGDTNQVADRLGQALQGAAAEHATKGTDAALVETMRSNAATLDKWR